MIYLTMMQRAMSGENLSGADETLEVALEGGVLSVTLNRPDALNALDVTLMAELRALWGELPAGVRCIVVTGAGRGFCAGADMSLLESDRADAAATVDDELAFL